MNILHIFSIILLLIGIFILILSIKLSEEDLKIIVKKISSFFSRKQRICLVNDLVFLDKIRETTKTIIGDKHFEELCELEKIVETPFIADSTYCKLPCIKICTYYDNPNQKITLTSALAYIARKYLTIYGIQTDVIPKWENYNELNIPALTIIYAPKILIFFSSRPLFLPPS